jgi:hypothetical protein
MAPHKINDLTGNFRQYRAFLEVPRSKMQWFSLGASLGENVEVEGPPVDPRGIAFWSGWLRLGFFDIEYDQVGLLFAICSRISPMDFQTR